MKRQQYNRPNKVELRERKKSAAEKKFERSRIHFEIPMMGAKTTVLWDDLLKEYCKSLNYKYDK